MNEILLNLVLSVFICLNCSGDPVMSAQQPAVPPAAPPAATALCRVATPQQRGEPPSPQYPVRPPHGGGRSAVPLYRARRHSKTLNPLNNGGLCVWESNVFKGHHFHQQNYRYVFTDHDIWALPTLIQHATPY